MQTERVTFLTTPENKAALDAYAADAGKSVGHVLREASMRYVAEGALSEGERFQLLIHELAEALPAIDAALDQAIEGQQRLRADIEHTLREAGLRA